MPLFRLVAVPRRSFHVRAGVSAGNFLALLEPGDIVLFQAAKRWTNAVCVFQRLNQPPYSAEAVEYSHAGVYVGGDDLVDAITFAHGTTGGVRRVSLRAFAPGKTVCAVRWTPASYAQKRQLAREAQNMIGQPYNYSAVAGAAYHYVRIKLRFGRNSNSGQVQRYISAASKYNRMICSQFVEKTYALTFGAATPLDAWTPPSPVFTPADIYMNTALDTVGGPP